MVGTFTLSSEQLSAQVCSTPYTLHTTHYTLHTAHCTLHTTPYTLHTRVEDSLFRVEGSGVRDVTVDLSMAGSKASGTQAESALAPAPNITTQMI